MRSHWGTLYACDFFAVEWLQVARNLLDDKDGFLRNATHPVHDRDPLYTKAWMTLLKSEGVHSVPIPAIALKPSEQVTLVRTSVNAPFDTCSANSVRTIMKSVITRGSAASSSGHQRKRAATSTTGDRVECRTHFGGLLNFYHREAA